MRKISTFLISLLICATGFSQEALRSAGSIISPEIHDNNTVTFRLNAPQAEKVEVTGDFLTAQSAQTPTGGNTGPRTAALAKNENGVWEYTTPQPLSSELYNYTFIVDGLRINDPTNVYMIRDVASITSIFIIGDGHADLYKVNNVPHGTVSRRWYDSPTLKEQRRMTIYTPSGYEASNEDYPILYLLHGSGGDEEAWIALGRTAQIMDNLIAQGKATPMIVVMPNGHTQNPAAPGETHRDYRPAMGGGARESVASMEESFEDIIKFVESNYRVKSDKANRAVAGLSMGGMHSSAISARYTNTFDYIGVFSAPPISSIRSTNEDRDKNIEEFVNKLKIQQANGFELYWIACGDTDFLYQSVLDSMEKMDEIGFNYTYRESDGGHIWRNWRIYLSEFAPMLFK